MSRPATPIQPRPRSRSGTRSPANVADRAVCKIAGRIFIYDLRYKHTVLRDS